MNWIELAVQGTIGLATVAIAIFAWRTSTVALRTSYRPVLRPVPLRVKGAGIQGHMLKLKNIGFGPAVAVMMFEANDDTKLIGEIDVVEPLQPPTGAGGEADRVGNVTFWVRHPAVLDDDGRSYRLLYQDIEGTWHESTFRIAGQTFIIRFLGPKRWWHRHRAIPALAQNRGQVATGDLG